jgi:hypothetical protein
VRAKAIYVRVSPEVEQHPRETAQRERRSISYVAAELLTEKLADDGRVPACQGDGHDT